MERFPGYGRTLNNVDQTLQGFNINTLAQSMKPDDSIPSFDLSSQDPEIRQAIDVIRGGEKKSRCSAERLLIRRATEGSVVDLLDVTSLTLLSCIVDRNPKVMPVDEFKVTPNPTALRNIKEFTIDLFDALSTESKLYTVRPDSLAIRERVEFAEHVLTLFSEVFSQKEQEALPIGFHSFKDSVLVNAKLAFQTNHSTILTISPELSPEYAKLINQALQKDPESLSQTEFDAFIKSHSNWHRRPNQISNAMLMDLFSETDPKRLAQTLHLFNNSLSSKDPAVRNRAVYALSQYDPTNPKQQIKLQWLSEIQKHFFKIANQSVKSDDNLTSEVETLILNFDNLKQIKLLSILFIDFDAEFAQRQAGVLVEKITVQSNKQLLDNLSNNSQLSPAIELLIRAFREDIRSHIAEESFLELFDPKRPLGFFLDNLQANYKDLQQITRESIWPSFIASRQAKIWPSERELDILRFIGRHPASVIGFSGIQFFTIGHTPPEVGLEFTFGHTENVLGGRLDKQGHLVELPFDLATTHPFIHAFLEHLAVGSFQELVTIADKRIKLKNQDISVLQQGQGKPRENNMRRPTPGTILPRRETSYITISDSTEKRTLTSEQMAEEARVRESLPKLISQKVVPLPYSQRFRYFRGLLQQARQGSAPAEEIKSLEGQMLYQLSLIPNPSGGKLDNLPPQFELEKTNQGKFLDTWRIHHLRPKPKEGEEFYLPTVFEKRFRAVPIALTQYLELWFTQPSSKK